MKQMYWLSIIIIFLASNLFPWSIFQNTFINEIQFPSRLYLFPQLFLSYIFAVGVTQYIDRATYRRWAYMTCLVLAIFFQFYGQKDVVNNYETLHVVKTPEIANITSPYRLGNSAQFKNLIPNSSSNELLPKQSLIMLGNIRTDKGLYNVNQTCQFDSKGNGRFIFNNGTNQSIGELNLPFIDYSGENYFVRLDGHIIPAYANKTSLLTINDVKPGQHTLQIDMTPSKMAWFSRLLTSVGLIIYVYFLLKEIAQIIKKIKDSFSLRSWRYYWRILERNLRKVI